MSHLRTFVANQVLSRIRAFLGVFCPDFYSDIEDFTQILCRYLSKISAAGTSVINIFTLIFRRLNYCTLSAEEILPEADGAACCK